MAERERVYWDTCIFLEWMLKGTPKAKPERLALLEPLVTAAETGELLIVTSTLTIAEIVRAKSGAIVTPDQERRVMDFTKNDFIHVRIIDRKTAELARNCSRTAAQEGRSLPVRDSIHLAAAVRARLTEMHTFDGQHLIPHSGFFGSPSLTVCQPRPIGGQFDLGLEVPIATTSSIASAPPREHV